MKIKRFSKAIHAVIWLLLLVIPYASTDQVFSMLDPASDVKYLLLCLTLSTVLIATFYFNYCVLIPKLFLSKKYWYYYSSLLAAIVAVFVLSAGLLIVSGITSELSTETNIVAEKVIPVILVNTMLLWLLSIVCSILWVMYDRLQQTESEKLTAQIATLKSQINPHFLFNTLNNIYATAHDGSPKAADMVDKLAEMMRYTMKDTQQDFVLLEDEVNYINNYIELQKLRLDRSVRLVYTSLDQIPILEVAPMLLIPFVENAFKHGVNSEQKSQISITIKLQNSQLELNVVNSKVNVQREIVEKSGLGIENTKHRLNLIYPSKHLLVVNETDRTFSVNLYVSLL